MKTQKEIEEKLKEVEGMMGDKMSSADDIKQLENDIRAIKDKTISDGDRMKSLVKIMGRPVEVNSLDAQLYILKWILDDQSWVNYILTSSVVNAVML